MKASLRYSNDSLRDFLRSEPQHKELIALKQEIFNSSEELILRSQQLLKKITEEYTDDQEFPKIQDQSFVYLYEKFDVIYQQEQAFLKSLFQAQTSKQDLEKESESKKRIIDLARCELLIHNIVKFSDEDNVPSLISLLEVLYDDYENLDVLLYLLYKKMWAYTKEQGDSLNRLTHFMIPFVKIFGKGGFDLFKTVNSTESNKIAELIRDLIKEIETSLQIDTQLDEKDIQAFAEELFANQENNEERRRLIRTISARKEDFKQEILYYKMLGNLGLLQYLYCAQEKEESKSALFLRVGIIASLFNARLLNLKNTKDDEYLMESLGALNEISLVYSFEIPGQFLRHILDKLEQQSQDQYIDLLELQTECIDRSFSNRDLIPDIKQGRIDLERYYELFFNEELYGSKVQECLWTRFYRFFITHASALVSRKSRYIMHSSVYEIYITVWASAIRSLMYQSFTKQQDVDESAVNLKYFPLISSYLQKILQLIINENLFFNILQKATKKELIDMGEKILHLDRKLLEKVEFIKLFEEIDLNTVTYLTQFENYGSDEEKDANDIHLTSIQQNPTLELIFSVFGKWTDSHIEYFGTSSEVGHFLDLVLDNSKLINYLLPTYQKKRTWVSHIKDKPVLRIFSSILISIFKLLSQHTTTLEDEKNSVVFKLIVEDIMRIDPSYLDKDQHQELYNEIENIFNQGKLMQRWKDWKLIISFLEFFWLRPNTIFEENDYSIGRVYRYFVDTEKDAEIVLKLAGKFVLKLEEKYKNLSIDYLENIKQLKEEVEKEQKEEEEKTRKEKEKEEAKKDTEVVPDTNNENPPNLEGTAETKDSKPTEEAKEAEGIQHEAAEPKGEEEKKDNEGEKNEEEAKQVEAAPEEKKKEERISFNFDKDGKLPKEKPLLEELKFLAINCCHRLQIISYRMAASSKGYFDEIKEQTQALIKRVARMTFTPLLVFADYKEWAKRIDYYVREICYYRSEHVGPIFEGFCQGIIELCETFKLVEESTFEKINKQSIHKLLLRIKNYGFIGSEALPHDFTWTEAALISLLLAVKHFGIAFKEHYDSHICASSDFTAEFQKASELFFKFTANLYKAIYKHLDSEYETNSIEAWKDYSKQCKKTLEAMHEIFESFSRFLSSVYRESQYIPALQKIYLDSLSRLDLDNKVAEKEEMSGKVKLAYNLSVVKEFITFIPTEQRRKREMIGELLFNASTIQRLTGVEKYILDEYFKYPHRNNQILISEAITVLGNLLNEELFEGESVWSYYKQSGKLATLENQIKGIFSKINDFLKDLDLERIIRRKYGILTENMDHIFKFFEELYKLYTKCLKEKVTIIDKKIETVEKTAKKSHKSQQKRVPDKKRSVEPEDFGMFDLFGDETGERPEQAVESEQAELDIFGLFGDADEDKIEVKLEEAKAEIVEQNKSDEVKPIGAAVDNGNQENKEIELTKQDEELQDNKNQPEEKKEEQDSPLEELGNLQSSEASSKEVQEKPQEAVEETKEIEKQSHESKEAQPSQPEENKNNEEDDIKKPATEQQTEEDDFFGAFNLDPPVEEVKKDEKEAEKNRAINEKVAIHKKEKDELLAEYKQGIEDYLKVCLPNAIYFTTVKDLIHLGELFNTIPRQFWIDEYEKVYKKTLLFVHEILNSESDAFLKIEIEKELKELEEIPGGGMKLDRTESTTLNRIMTLDFYFQQIKQFFEDKIARDLKMSKAFIESLVVIVNSLWREILTMDLTPFKKDIKEFSLFGNISNIIINIGKIVVDYIVVNTVSNFSVIDDNTTTTQGTFQNLLFSALDMTDLSLSVHNRLIQDFKHSILEEFEECHETVMNLMGVILRSNKALRVPFLNRGILAKLLDVKKFEFSGEDQLGPLMSLFGVLLEDSLPMENQVEFALKEEVKDNDENDSQQMVSLESISNSSKFKIFKNYKRFLNVLEAYQIDQKDQTKIEPLKSEDLVVKDTIGKSNMFDFRQNKKSPQKVNMIKYLQDNISPVSLKTLHTLLKALITNCSSEEESLALYLKKMQKQNEKEDRNKLKKQQKAKNQSISSIESEDDEEDEDEEDSDLDRELALYDKNVPFKDSTVLVVALSCIVRTCTYLIPHIIFQEANLEDLSNQIPKDNPIWILFNERQNRYSLLDTILRLLLWRDGESALFIVAALLHEETLTLESDEPEENENNNSKTESESKKKKEIPFKYLLLSKIFQIIEDMLDLEFSSGKGLKSFESMLMRQNLARVVSYISQNYLDDFSQQEDEVQKTIVNILQKLLFNIEMLASFMEWTDLERPLLDILSGIITKNMEQNLEQAKIKECYIGVLRTIEEGHEKNKKEISPALKNKFEDLIFKPVKDFSREEVNIEEQKLFEMWDEKEQWQKEETKKIMSVSRLKNTNDMTVQFECSPHDSTLVLTDQTFREAYRGNKKEIESLLSFYNIVERKEIKDFKSRKDYYDYYKYWRDTNRSLQNLSTSYSQGFGCSQDYPSKPLVVRYYDDKSQYLQEDKKIISGYVEQYNTNKGLNSNLSKLESQEEEKKIDVEQSNDDQKQEKLQSPENAEKKEIETDKDVKEENKEQIIEANVDKESEDKIDDGGEKNKEEINANEISQAKENEEVQITGQEEIVAETKKVEHDEEVKEENKKEEEKKDEKDDASVDEEGAMIIRYFYNENVNNVQHLRYQVNKALKQGRKLKEAICVERTLRIVTGKGLGDLNIEEMIKELTKNMREFDRNVVYASLGKEIKSSLSETMKKEIYKIEKEFAKMKEDFYGYNSRLENLSRNKEQEKGPQVKNTEEEKEVAIETKEEVKEDGNTIKQEEAKEIEKEIMEVKENVESNIEGKEEKDQISESKEQPKTEENNIVTDGETATETEQEPNKLGQEQQKEAGSEEEKKEEIVNNEAQPEEAKDDALVLDVDENKENEAPKEEIIEEASEYDEMEEDHKFLADTKDDEGDKKSKDEQASEQESLGASLNHIEEEKKDEIENAEEQKDLNGDFEERNSPTSKAKQARRKEVTDDTKKLINAFRLDDTFLLKICTLFFAKYTTKAEPLEVITRFFSSAISRNPVNDLKVLDALIFILHTPELLESSENEGSLDFPPKKYISSQETVSPQVLFQTTAENIIHYMTTTMKSKERSYVVFTPARYLNKYGNKLLEPLKEKTGYSKKISQYYSALDMIIGMLELPLILESKKCTTKIVELVKELLTVEKKIVLGEGNPEKMTLENYKKYFSYKNIYTLLNILSSPHGKDPELQTHIEELFSCFKELPDLFISLQEHLSSYTLALIPSTNKVLEDSIKTLKESNLEELTKEIVAQIIENLNLSQFQISKVILGAFVNVFYHHLFTNAKKNTKNSQKVYGLLQNVIQDLFTSGSIQSFMLNIYEVADLIHKTKETLKSSDSQVEFPLVVITELCLCHYSLIIMQTSCDPIQEKEDQKKENGSISDIEPMPKLARLVSYEDSEPTIEITSLKRTFSHYKRQNDVDFKTIFANFGLKYSKAISHLSQSIRQKKDSVLSYALTTVLPKCPWILDLETKREMMIQKIRNHQKDSGMPYYDDRRSVTIDRKALVYSTLNAFKNLNKRDLLLNMDISYKDERGIDAGGLRREFFSLMSKELFDPNVGLFRMSDNKLSIQPSLFSGIVPHHLKFFELAGFVLAKAIEDEIVVDLSFTKSFLKHILGKEITISDLEDVDADLGRNLQWILQNDVEELYLTFTHEVEILGERVTLELKEGGFDIFVNEENKKEYVKKVSETRMTKEIEKQLKAFLKGFHIILPKDCLSHLSSGELELIIAGTPHIDLEEMKKYASISGHNQSSVHIKWLWEVLKEFNQEDLAAFLYFVSGSPKVPYGGFKDYPINVSKCSHKGGLPIAHTCSYEIELPEYESKDKLREKLLMAIFDGVEGFFIS